MTDAADPGATAVYPALTDLKGPRVGVEAAGLTHAGKVRKHNEDQFLIAKLAKSMRVLSSSFAGHDSTWFADEEGHVFIVADGMGGAAAGEQASALAVATLDSFLLNALKWFMHVDGEEHTLFAELRAAFDRADRAVMDRAREDRRLAGMGTTLTMAYAVGEDLYVVHAGDSRAYLRRKGRLTRITRDDTLVQMMVDGGLISAEDAKVDKRRHVVTNVVGGPERGVHAAIHKLRVEQGDVLLLCSDGLTEPVDDLRIDGALAAAPTVEEACRLLVQHALDGGGSDNITAVVVRFSVA